MKKFTVSLTKKLPAQIIGITSTCGEMRRQLHRKMSTTASPNPQDLEEDSGPSTKHNES